MGKIGKMYLLIQLFGICLSNQSIKTLSNYYISLYL